MVLDRKREYSQTYNSLVYSTGQKKKHSKKKEK